MNNDKYKKYFKNIEITGAMKKRIFASLNKQDLSWPFGVTKEFEEKINQFLNVKYTLAHCNGTSAMYSAMHAVGVGKNTEVICPTYTFWASIAPAINLGAQVVFCDINKNDLLIKVNAIKDHITPKTRAIVIPHLWGRFGEINKLKKICKGYDQKIFIIEDASHCFGAKHGKKFLGTLGDVGIFSLQAGKTLVAGEGGILVTNNFKIYDSAVYLGHYERIKFLAGTQYSKYSKTGGGYKFRIHPLASSLALSQLDNIEKKLKMHNKLMSYYESKLECIPQIQTFKKEYKNFIPGGHFGLRVAINIDMEQKLKFIDECNKSGLRVENEYIPLLHNEEFFIKNKARNIGKNVFKGTQKFHNFLVSLPIFHNGDYAIIDSYIEEFRNILERYTEQK